MEKALYSTNLFIVVVHDDPVIRAIDNQIFTSASDAYNHIVNYGSIIKHTIVTLESYFSELMSSNDIYKTQAD